MQDWAIFLRGVNVGGNNRLPMADWRRVLEGQGIRAPQTYIQSGNAVLGAPGPADALARLVAEGIAAAFGFRPAVLALPPKALEAALDHPFGAEVDPSRVLVFFHDAADPDLTRAEGLRVKSEVLVGRPGHLLLHAPEGIGRSNLAAALPRLIGGAVTARNLTTVAAVLGMLRSRKGEDAAG